VSVVILGLRDRTADRSRDFGGGEPHAGDARRVEHQPILGSKQLELRADQTVDGCGHVARQLVPGGNGLRPAGFAQPLVSEPGVEQASREERVPAGSLGKERGQPVRERVDAGAPSGVGGEVRLGERRERELDDELS
jgi:hypothetical protein